MRERGSFAIGYSERIQNILAVLESIDILAVLRSDDDSGGEQ